MNVKFNILNFVLQESVYSGRSSIIHLEYDNSSIIGDKQSPTRPSQQEKLFSHYDTNDGEYSSYNNGPASETPSYNHQQKPTPQYFYFNQPNHVAVNLFNVIINE